MAEQVMAAITEAQRTNICVYSVDGSPATKTALVNGTGGMTGIGAQTVRSICIVSLITEKRKNLDLRTSKKMKSSTVFPLYSTNGWIHRISAISILMH